MPKSYSAMYLLEYLLRQARDRVDGLPDDTMRAEVLGGLRENIRQAHGAVCTWLGDVERLHGGGKW
jgi:hypothetical protein